MTILETSLSRIFGAIRQRKSEKSKGAHQVYRDLVGRFVAGEEVDVDEIEITLELANKTDADLETDVHRLQSRIELAAQLSHYAGIKQKLPALEAAHQAAINRFEESVAKLQQTVNETGDQLRAAQHEAGQAGFLENKLIETCDDPDILSREQAIIQRRKEIRAEIDEINERFGQTFAAFDYAQAQLDKRAPEGAMTTLRNYFGELMPVSHSDSKHQEKLAEEWQAGVDSRRDIVLAQRGRLAELESENRQLSAELAELSAKKLIP